MASNPIKVALTGFGSVGQSLAQILLEEPNLPLVITLVADRGGVALDSGGLDPSQLLEAKGRGSVVGHPNGRSGALESRDLETAEADVLLELASTRYTDGEPGWSYIRMALRAGMDIVLASKGPLVAHWDELFALAVSAGRTVAYSATHGAPMPAIDLARTGLNGSRLFRIRALLNSTSGMLLERMEEGVDLSRAIEGIVTAGVAETDPILDVEGWDAAAKCVILARSLFAGSLTLEDVDRTGIQGLALEDVVEAAKAGTPIKLVCTLEPGPHAPSATVKPERILLGDPLGTLRNGALGIVYEAEPIGPVFLAAYGAGGRPTAAAVIRDVLNLRPTARRDC